MNKIQITIWATAEEIAMVDNKITVKKGSFYYNGNKYQIINGEIMGANTAFFADDNHSTIQDKPKNGNIQLETTTEQIPF